MPEDPKYSLTGKALHDGGTAPKAGGAKEALPVGAVLQFWRGLGTMGVSGIQIRQRDRQGASCRGRREESMSNELIGILVALAAVGVALAGLILAGNRGLRQDIKRGEIRLEGQINGLRGEVTELRERMPHLEGLLEGLSEAITGRAAAR